MLVQSSQAPKGLNLINKFFLIIDTCLDCDLKIVQIGPPIFAHLTQHPKSYALQCFSINQTPQKCHSRKGIHIPIYNTCFLDLPDSASQNASRSVQPFCTAHGRESVYFTMCVKTWLTHVSPRLKKLIAAKNTIF